MVKFYNTDKVILVVVDRSISHRKLVYLRTGAERQKFVNSRLFNHWICCNLFCGLNTANEQVFMWFSVVRRSHIWVLELFCQQRFEFRGRHFAMSMNALADSYAGICVHLCPHMSSYAGIYIHICSHHMSSYASIYVQICPHVRSIWGQISLDMPAYGGYIQLYSPNSQIQSSIL